MQRYDSRTGLVVVDVQNDFADPAGSLSVPGATSVIDSVNEQVAAATAAGAVVVYTQDWHPPRTYRLPSGSAKSFCTSTTTSAVRSS